MFSSKNYSDQIKKILLLFFPFSLLLGPAVLNIYIFIFIILFLYLYKLEPILTYKYFFFSSLILSIYLIFASSLQYLSYDSFIKSLLFFRFPLFAIITALVFYKFSILEKYLKIIMFIFIFLFFDSFIQFFFQKNIFLQEPLTTGNVYRITSVFGNESILGSYILKIVYPSLIIFSLKYKKNNFLFLLFFILSLLLVIISGERIILLKYLLLNLILLLFLKKYKYLFLTISLSIVLISLFFYSSDYFNERLIRFYEAVINFINTPYFPIFEKAYLIAKENLLFGAGFKNFRNVCSYEQYALTISYMIDNGCSTHPHNYILEILSETGIIGFILFFNIFLYVIIKSLYNFRKVDYIVFISLFFVLLWPIGTNSSFFSSFNGYIIWFNIGIILFYTRTNENFNSYK